MIKLVVSDFDGTLIDKDEAIPISTVLTIDELRSKGVKFAIATGRVLSSILSYNKDVSFIDYVISCNGAYLYDVNLEKEIWKKPMLKRNINKILKLFPNESMYFCTVDDWFLYKNGDTEFNSCNIIQNLDEFLDKKNKQIYKIEINFKRKIDAKKGLKKLEENVDNLEFNLQSYDDNYIIEVTSNEINKAVGLNKIMKNMKIQKDEVLVIGDSYNDKEMLKSFLYSVAVDNAPSEIKKCAKYKTSSNTEKGVEKILKELLNFI